MFSANLDIVDIGMDYSFPAHDEPKTIFPKWKGQEKPPRENDTKENFHAGRKAKMSWAGIFLS